MVVESDWRSTLGTIGIPDYMIECLGPVFNRLRPLSRSVILTGSWAIGENTRLSDLDLLVIVQDMTKKEKVEDLLALFKWPSRERRRSVDIKVVAETEIPDRTNEHDYFATWLRLKVGITLLGTNACDLLVLKPPHGKRIAEGLLDDINQSFAWLESGIRFTGTAITIMNVLKTFYFIERYLLLNGKHPQTKNALIEDMLGDSYNLLVRIYYDLGNNLFKSTRIRVSAKREKQYSNQDYAKLLDRTSHIMEYMERIYRQLTIIA